MSHRTHRFWRGWFRVPATKRFFPLIIAAALLLAGASVAVSAAVGATPKPPPVGTFCGPQDGVEACPAQVDDAPVVSWIAQEPDPTAPPEQHATGFIAPPMDLSYLAVESLPGRLFASLPMSRTFDWRDRGGVDYVTAVRDQGVCAACWAFAALGNIESKMLIDGVSPAPDYSENHAKECTWIGNNVSGWGDCLGGNYLMMANLYSKTGTVAEADDAYTPTDGTCQSPTGPYQTTLLGWQMISGSTAAMTVTIKQALVENGPVYSAFYTGDDLDTAWEDTFNDYNGSTVLNYTGAITETNHAVVIVGWDDTASHTGGNGAWIVKNSWGTAWGDSGYFEIAYDSAGIGSYVSYITEWQPYDAGGDLLHYDEAGFTAYTGYVGHNTAWGSNVFTATVQTNVTRVEFWAPDAMSDVDVYLYDTLDNGAPAGLLSQSTNHTYPTAGYYSVPLAAPLAVAPGDDIVAVVKFTARNTTMPVAVDVLGPGAGNSYLSHNGLTWSASTYDVGIRLRTSTMPVDLALTKEVLGAGFGPGDAITFTLTIENTGAGPARNTIVTDTIPSEVINTSFASTVLITATAAPDYVWQLSPLAGGQTAAITITGQIAGSVSQGEAFENEAVVYDPQDLWLTNNTSRVLVNARQVFLPLVMRN